MHSRHAGVEFASSVKSALSHQGTTYRSLDFVKVAEALGAVGIRVSTKEEMGPALEKAIAMNRPVVIDCQIDRDDKVFPMVPAGAPIEDAFDQDDLKKEN